MLRLVEWSVFSASQCQSLIDDKKEKKPFIWVQSYSIRRKWFVVVTSSWAYIKGHIKGHFLSK